MFGIFSYGLGMISNLQIPTRSVPDVPKIQCWLAFCMHPDSDFDLGMGIYHINNLLNAL